MQAGQNLHDPLTQLNSHLGFGAMAGLNPFPGMGVNPNDPNMVRYLPPLRIILRCSWHGSYLIVNTLVLTDAKYVEFS